ncbi:MAG TPA: hypothetical protein VGL72_08260 [Bryobacteraceae bacterium]|jgi:anti-sigma factor RsiW
MMPHPSESDLALYAGNDLGRLDRLRVDWHLRTCGKCQQEVTEFSSLRADTARSAAEPDVNWGRLAAEMKANIRLGLEAGECITPVRVRDRAPARWAWAVLATSALIAIGAGSEIWMNHPWSPATASNAAANPTVSTAGQDIVLEVTDRGIQMRDGDSVNELSSNSTGAVAYSANAQGSVSASYVDRDTGMVTVNNIFYGQ